MDLTAELVHACARRLPLAHDQVQTVVETAVEYLVQHYAGTDIYIPALMQRSAIREALDCGATVQDICRTFGVARSTVYRIIRDVRHESEN